MKIAMACDHGGLRLKNVLKADLEKNGYEVEDFGTYTEESCDYPDFASKAAKAVASGSCDKGVVVCGTGIGVSITANKVDGIRCSLCHDVFSAKATRQHNDSGERKVMYFLLFSPNSAFFISYPLASINARNSE